MKNQKQQFKTHKKRWQKMAKLWQGFTEPGRPSRNDIFNYNILTKIALKKKKQPRIILLGATPELRDMLFKYSIEQGAKIYCVDMTVDMYQAMSQLVENKNPNEKFIHSNWLNIPLPERSFDLVMGDFIIDNLTNDYQNLFLAKIKNLLRRGGYFITRNCVLKSNLKIKNVRQAFQKYIKRVLNEELTIKQAANWVAQDLIWGSWFKNKEEKTSLGYFEKEIRALKNKLKKNTIEGIIFQKFLETWWPMKDKYWTMHLAKDDKKILQKYFKIKKILYSNDYDLAKVSPIYLLRTKR